MQNPHCRAWHSRRPAAPATARRCRARASPSTVVTCWPSTETAKIRQDRTGSPSSSTVQAPQTPCSQPTWVPVRPRSWRRKSHRVRRADDPAGRSDAVDRQRHVVRRFGRHAAARSPGGRDRLPGRPYRQDTGQMSAVVGGGVQVGDCGSTAPRACVRGVRGSARQASVRSSTSGMSATDRYPQRSLRSAPWPVEFGDGGDPAQRVIAVPAGDLDERGTGAGRQGREVRARPPARPHEARRVSGPRKKSAAAIVRVPPAGPRGDRAPADRQHRRQLAGRIGVRQRTDAGAAVADGRVGHQPQRLPQQGLHPDRVVVAFDPGVPGQRADRDARRRSTAPSRAR